MELSWGLALISFITSGAGAYLGSYLKRKGENLASHEDIEKLVDQVRAVTTATKEIEAKISNDVWDRQKQWELKREILFEATKRLAEVEDALLALHSVSQVEQANRPKGDDTGWLEIKSVRFKKWSRATAAFDETRQFVGVVCQKETIDAIDWVGVLANAIAAKIGSGDIEIYGKSQLEREKRYSAARAAIRKELRVDGSSRAGIDYS